MYEYINLKRVCYDSGATFVPVCAKCGRFVKPPKTILMNENGYIKQNTQCSKCGKTSMLLEGYV